MTTSHTPRRIITCTNCGRDRPYNAHDWCAACYSRWRCNGRPADGPPPPRNSTRADVDELVVEHAVAGYRPELNPAETRAAVAVLRSRGFTYLETADRLGCTDRTVARHVAALKTAAIHETKESA